MSSDHHDSLPQCGFGTDIDFDTLIKSNPFLFRVYTPKERSPFSDETDPFFIAPRFNELVARSPVDLPNIKFPETLVGSYAEVARHMDWTTKSSSCYISTSFSFAWAIWEAVRRYHTGVKKDVQIAIIDAAALGGRAATAVQLLMKSTPRQRDQQFDKWLRFSQDSQTALVYGMVPRPAVLASIPLLHILRKMPSYFLRKDIQVIPGNPLEQVAWNYTNRKQNYRQFCHDMSNVFLGRPADVKLRDSTGGAVRLALSFLRPFFHRVVQDDFDLAVSYLRTLAIAISRWPANGWAENHLEVLQVVESLVLALGEELREKYAHQHGDEVSRLKLVISGLEATIKLQNEQLARHVEEDDIDSDDDFEIELEESDEPTLVTPIEAPAKPINMRRQPSALKMSIAVLPRLPLSFQTPITPPESPRHSLHLPTITIPLTEVISTQFTFKPMPPAEASCDVAASPSPTRSPRSAEPASPPPTPPARSPVFVAPRALTYDPEETHSADDEAVDAGHAEDQTDHEQEQNIRVIEQEDDLQETEQKPHPDLLEEIKQLEREIEGTLARDVVGHQEPHMLDEILEDDGEDTDHEDDAGSFPSPSMSWIPMSPSSLSSRRSSIISLETLCESPGLPLKRLSFARSRTTSFDFSRRLSFSGSLMPSRTVSFSEPMLGLIPYPTPPAIDIQREPLPSTMPSTPPSEPETPAAEAWTVPLPPSPTSSIRSLSSSSSPSLSRSSSSESESSSSSSSVSVSQPSPPSSRSLPLESDLPIRKISTIILPRRISLLSPLPEPDELDTESDTQSIRSVGVTETALYIVTGFLVGAFLTLFLFSTQRRTLLYVT